MLYWDVTLLSGCVVSGAGLVEVGPDGRAECRYLARLSPRALKLLECAGMLEPQEVLADERLAIFERLMERYLTEWIKLQISEEKLTPESPPEAATPRGGSDVNDH